MPGKASYVSAVFTLAMAFGTWVYHLLEPWYQEYQRIASYGGNDYEAAIELLANGEYSDAIEALEESYYRKDHLLSGAALAEIYHTGFRITPRKSEAKNIASTILDRLELAVDSGSSDAARYMASFERYGLAVQKDQEKAVQTLERAIANDDDWARYHLASLLLEQDRKKNLVRAEQLLRISAENLIPAKLALSEELLDLRRSEQEKQEAVKTLATLAESHPYASNYLGFAYENGRGVEKDAFLAYYYYRRAADRKLSSAQVNLALLIKNYGHSIPLKEPFTFWLEEAASGGNLRAKYLIGLFHLLGEGYPKDFAKAESIFLELSSMDSGYGFFGTGLLYRFGLNSQGLIDIEEAEEKFLTAANMGVGEGYFQIGLIYFNGIEKPKDLVRSKRYFTMAHDEGVQNGTTALAYQIYSENSDPTSIKRARSLIEPLIFENAEAKNIMAILEEALNSERELVMELFRESAEAGNPNAAQNLAERLEKSARSGVEAEEAADHYRKAAAADLPRAQFKLAMMYLEGRGVTKSSDEGLRLLRLSAGNGFPAAQHALASRYNDGSDGVEVDNKAAFKLLEASGAAGNSNATNDLGVAYAKGLGVDQSYSKARELYKEAADAGSLIARSNLGWLQINGMGGTQDILSGLANLELAAKNGLVGAQHNLGCLYAYGRGVEKDFEKSLFWYDKAIESDHIPAMAGKARVLLSFSTTREGREQAVALLKQAAFRGNPYAMYRLGELLIETSDSPEDQAEGLYLVMSAADRRNSCAQNYLGSLYEEGRFFEKSFSAALKWYERAAKNGLAAGMFNAGRLLYEQNDSETTKKRSLDFLNAASAEKNTDAMLLLADMIQTGFYEVDSTANAIVVRQELLTQAARLGDTRALDKLPKPNLSRSVALCGINPDDNILDSSEISQNDASDLLPFEGTSFD